MTKITVRYASVDRFSQIRTFKTLAAACRFARKWIGDNADFGTGYAVSSDGIGKITVTGCTIGELFSGVADKPAGPYEVWALMACDQRCIRSLSGSFATLTEANAHAQELDEHGCVDGIELFGRTDEAKGQIEAQRLAYQAQLFIDSNCPF